MSSSKLWIPRELDWKPSALRGIRKLGPERGSRVKRAFERLAETGRGDVKPVEPREIGYLELRIGLGLRGVFRDDGDTITVYKVGKEAAAT